VLAGFQNLLRLPYKFTDSMERQEMAYANLRECSGGQPTYHVEIYYDGQGECYFRDGCKGKLPLSVFLVINDNPYGLMFSLSFL
jgi:hypothetical protein